MDDGYQCPHCKKTCKSARGVTQHINQSPACLAEQHRQVSRNTSQRDRVEASRLDALKRSFALPSRRSLRVEQASQVPDSRPTASGLSGPPEAPAQDATEVFPEAEDTESEGKMDSNKAPRKANLARKRPVETNTSEDTSSGSDDEAAANSSGNGEAKATNQEPPNTEMLAKFRLHCSTHKDKHLRLSKEDITGVKLMNTLKRRAPLTAYEEVLEWHLKETGTLSEDQKLGDAHKCRHRHTLMKALLPRYNLEEMIPKEKRVRLPSSNAVVTVPYFNAQDCIVSLLTDPRFHDEDYLFFDNDPLAPPPEKVTYLEDLNTGQAYLRSHEKMITKPNQVLLSVPFYIDAANTGQFADLPVTPLKLSLGTHKRETRDKPFAWKALGYVPIVRKDPARGKRIMKETGHLESQDVVVLDGEGAANGDEEDTASEEEELDGACKAQDFHTMLSAILESFVELQRTVFVWDLVHKGKEHKGIEFVIFVPFVKCDTEEGDLLCGKYTVRTGNVKHVCRYCHCPTQEADDPRVKYPPKRQAMIQNLVEIGDLEGLQAISQQNIQNAWYKVRFHAANDAGIHGACPSEKLHAIQLGVFKYIREIFFKHMGRTSQLADDINGLSTIYGKVLNRQSEKDLPNTNFAKGIQKGKLMARDFRGVLLIMAAILRSTKGRMMLMKRRKFGGERGLRDWTLLVELMLEWEAYLGQPKMQQKHVKRLAKKHRFLMYIMKNVASRSSGMGLKLMKFHAILHLISDMLLCGVPSEFDTGSNESHHKESKCAARLTQRKEATFIMQTATRLIEFLCIELAMEEILHDGGVWQCFDNVGSSISGSSASDSGSCDSISRSSASRSDSSADETESDTVTISTSGARIRVCEDPENDNYPSFEMLSRSKTMNKKTRMLHEAVVFLNDLQNLVLDYIPEKFLQIRTEQKRGGNWFRGHPNFRSLGPWKDWVVVDWGDWGQLPAHIWCFVVLSNMPNGKDRLEFGGVCLQDGVYAVVESAVYNEDVELATQSDLFTPLLLDVDSDDEDNVIGRNFYLANTNAFVEPCCVIPDIGGPSNAYFQVAPRREWSDSFVSWLEAPHKDDVMMYSEDEKDDKNGV